MARDRAPNDTGDTGDEVVVPITAPGTGPRDLTIAPADPAESDRCTERTSSPRGKGARRGVTTGRSSGRSRTDDQHIGRTDRSSASDGTDDHHAPGTDDPHHAHGTDDPHDGTTDRSSGSDDHHAQGADGRRAGGTDGRRAGRTDEPSAGRADGLFDDDLAHSTLGFRSDPDGPDSHVVGHDRLADVVTTFGATLESIRASQGRAPRHNLPTGSGTNQKRIAQVVQATPVDASRVVELIRSNTARTPLLALDADDPAVGRGDVVFPGRLRMPGGTRRRVELRVYPTASGNLTVLELLPRRSWMPQTRRYLRAGVPAITTLSDAIEEAAASS